MATPAKPKPPTVKELKEQLPPVKNANAVHQDQLSKLDKLALAVTNKVGTMGFFFIILAWTILWLGYNVIAPKSARFDPYPAFVLWLFISNLIQINLMPLILIGQNLQGRTTEIRASHDYDTDVRAEKEIEAILLHLENQQEIMMQVLKKIEKLEAAGSG
jgi:uncharacterized membrane protein